MSEKQPTLHEAFLSWQKAMPNIARLRQGHGYRYVGLSELLTAVLPPLNALGFTLRHQTVCNDGELTVSAVLEHASGQTMGSSLSMQMAQLTGTRGTNPMQAMGSVITYARRYTTLAVLGLTDGIDTDAADVATPAAPGPWDDQCAEWVSRIEDADDLEASRKLWSEAIAAMNKEVKDAEDQIPYKGRLLAAGQACKLRLEGNGEVPW